MTNDISNNQRGHDNTQIGVQNNNETIDNSQHNQFVQQTVNVGVSLEEVSRMVTNLFLDNFPRMYQIAKEVADKRADELWNEIVKKLEPLNGNDLQAFIEPDVQYVLYEAQKSYARFGTEEMLGMLSSLIKGRIKNNDSQICLKVAIDKAISIAGLLNQEQLDYLSLTFIVKSVKLSHVKDVENLNRHFAIMEDAFGNANISSFEYLDMLGCFSFNLGTAKEVYERTYPFIKTGQSVNYPQVFEQIPGDYSTSHVGTILAIANAEAKTPYKFNPSTWIHT